MRRRVIVSRFQKHKKVLQQTPNQNSASGRYKLFEKSIERSN